MTAIASGTVLKDRYRLDRLLGRGGMAAVWLGHDDVLDRPVAVKVLSDTIASDPDFLARFRREATVAAGLSHPNLVDVYDYSESDERPYLVMEFVSGRDLGSLIAREVVIDREKLAQELLGAVAHIHAAGIIHRDIKPHNIVLEADRTAKLIDFGIALPRDATSLTQTGVILATRRYAAPEVMEGRPASERSDLYSCGVVLQACGFTGPAELQALVSALTARDPAHRPRSAQQALAALEDRVDHGQPTEAFAPTFAGPRDPEREPGSGEEITTTHLYPRSVSRRKRWLAAAAILGVVAALAIAIVVFTGSRSPSPGAESAATPTRRSQGQTKDKRDPTPVRPSADAGSSQGDAAAGGEASPPTVPRPTGNDPVLGSSLNQEGFELIQAGSYEEAVPVLEEAVRAFPAGTEETAYAYALFNLGDALRLSGRPEAAIPVLEERLLIPNQTEVVRRELEAARSEAG